MKTSYLITNTPLLPLLILLLFKQNVYSQKDTIFWFACPEVSNGGTSFYDRPVAFRFSTYVLPATVTVSQPANPSFPTQTVIIPANSTSDLFFPPFFDFVENTSPLVIQNKGFLIQSSSPITAYYEVIGSVTQNPEIFSLKGQNAIGTTFYVPFQNIANNTNTFSPLPFAGFDIVATENNTSITVILTKSVIGGGPSSPLTFLLNRGQTVSIQSSSLSAAEHPSGSKVTSNKPIAITMKDDGLDGGQIYGNYCRDLVGAQIVPVEKLGTKYVVQKGFLNGNEFAFIVATMNGTQVSMDGLLYGAINEGQTLTLPIINGGHFISATDKIYVLQLTGIGCEFASEVLPDLDCSGSSAVRFVRTNTESFYLFLTTKAGNESGFVLNGNMNAVALNLFNPVPGSNGEFVSAVIPLSTFQVPALQSSIIENTIGDFQMGFLNGGSNTGCRFGFFSDYGNHVRQSKSISLCPGQSISINGQEHSQPGIVLDTIPGVQGCDTIITYAIQLAEYDLVFQIDSLSCSNGQVNLHYTLCNLLDGVLPPTVAVALYDTDPTVGTATYVGNILVQTQGATDCISGTLTDASAALALAGIPTLFALVNFDGSSQAPISLTNFPFLAVEECDYTNNLSTFLFQLPITEAQAQDESCKGPGKIIVSTTSGIPPFAYSLNGEPWVSTPNFDNLAAGTYLLAVRDAQGCQSTSVHTIDSYTPITVHVDSILHIDCRREKGLIALRATGGNQPYSFSIANGMPQSNGRFDNLDAGIYSFVVTDEDTCETHIEDLIVRQSTDTSLTFETIDLCSCLFFVLPNGDSTDRAGTYPVVLTRENGCDSTIVVTIEVSPNNYYVPNVFSPERSGPNESFVVFSNPACIRNINLLQVYDRWGSLIFERRGFPPNDYALGWYGDVRGQPAPPGVYTYYIELQLNNGSLLRHSGSVTLVR